MRNQCKLISLMGVLFLTFFLFSCVTIGRYNLLKREVEVQGERLDNLQKKLFAYTSTLENTMGEKIEKMEELAEQVSKINAEMSIKSDNTARDLDKLRGLTEEITFNLQQMQRELQAIQDFIDKKFGESLGTLPMGVPLDSGGMFDAGQRFLKQGKFNEARIVLRKFINNFPNDDNADDAQFLIGEAYFQEGKYDEANREFSLIEARYPKTDLLGKAGLRIGEGFIKLGKCKQALQVYKYIVGYMKKAPEVEVAKEMIKKYSADKACK